ncbi:MAG: zinc-ribbon domain-containing protein, partial [Candidatus Kariarchaeum pelagius]
MSATDLGNEPNFCPKCGVKIPQVGSKFCSSCGFSLQSTQQSILPAVNSNLNSSNITSNTAKPVDYSKQNVS